MLPGSLIPLGGEGNLGGIPGTFVVELPLWEPPPPSPYVSLWRLVFSLDWEEEASTGHLLSAGVPISPPCLAHVVWSAALPFDLGEECAYLSCLLLLGGESGNASPGLPSAFGQEILRHPAALLFLQS